MRPPRHPPVWRARHRLPQPMLMRESRVPSRTLSPLLRIQASDRADFAMALCEDLSNHERGSSCRDHGAIMRPPPVSTN
jgi:hypothetical protein